MWQSSQIDVPATGLFWVDSDMHDDTIRSDTFGTLVLVVTQDLAPGVLPGVISCSYDFVAEQPAENDSLVTGGTFAYIHDPGFGFSWDLASSGPLSSEAAVSANSTLTVTLKPSVGNVACDAPGAFFVQQTLRFASSSVPVFWTSPTEMHMNFPETVDVYTGAYGFQCPDNLGAGASSAQHSTGNWPVGGSPGNLNTQSSSCIIYADAPWNFTAAQNVTGSYRTDIWIIALDSLPFASLAAARRAKALDRAAAAALLEHNAFASAKLAPPPLLRKYTKETVLHSVSSSSSSSSSASSSSCSSAPTMLTSLTSAQINEQYVLVPRKSS